MNAAQQARSDWFDHTSWLEDFQADLERRLGRVLELPAERALEARWGRALKETRHYALRPAKRLRPALLAIGHGLARRKGSVPEGLWSFAIGVELLHTFLLVHDDVADGADTRRGGPALHRCLAAGRRGEDLAIVVGDHLFALAVDLMLGCNLPATPAVVRYYLGVCRETAAGQYLDLELSGAELAAARPLQAIRIAALKTSRYSFVAPLVAGARLGGGATRLVDALERVGHAAGLAYQLRDDLTGLFGNSAAAAKPVRDLEARKLTLPVLAAYAQAPASVRHRLEALWEAAAAEPAAAAEMRGLVEDHGGRRVAEQAIAGATRTARHWTRMLPDTGGMRAALEEILETVVR
jgi:geranylgeranyl diphosphate synthase, type I